MSSSGPRYPTVIAENAIAPYDDNAWTNHDNVIAYDGVYSSVTASNFDSGDYTYRIGASSFGFSIPPSATVDGILVEVERRYANGTVKDGLVALYNSVGAQQSEDKAETLNNWPGSDTIKSYGGASDLWGLAWTPAAINASSFEVRFTTQASANDAVAFVDFIRVTVYYTEGTPQLAVQSAAHAHLASTVTMTTPAEQLLVQNAASSHAADSPSTLTQHQILAADQASHAHTAENLTLEVSGELTPQGASHAHGAGSAELTQYQVLAAHSAARAQQADAPSLVVELTVEQSSHDHTASTPDLVQHHSLSVQTGSHAHGADGITLTMTKPPTRYNKSKGR